MTTEIQTTTSRVSKLKKIVASLGLITLIITGSGAYIGDYYLNADIDFLKDKLTKHEYKELKKDLIKKADAFPSNLFLLTPSGKIWKAILDKEKCFTEMKDKFDSDFVLNLNSRLKRKCKN